MCCQRHLDLVVEFGAWLSIHRAILYLQGLWWSPVPYRTSSEVNRYLFIESRESFCYREDCIWPGGHRGRCWKNWNTGMDHSRGGCGSGLRHNHWTLHLLQKEGQENAWRIVLVHSIQFGDDTIANYQNGNRYNLKHFEHQHRATKPSSWLATRKDKGISPECLQIYRDNHCRVP